MADAKRYQVVSACVLLPVRTADGGDVFNTLYRPATFLADPDNHRVKHNVDSGYIVEIGENAVGGVDAAGAPMVDDERHDGEEPGTPVALNDPGTVNEAAHRAAGRTSDGGADKADADRADAPRRGRPSADEKKTLVEQAVKAGMSRAEAEKASVADLRAALGK